MTFAILVQTRTWFPHCLLSIKTKRTSLYLPVVLSLPLATRKWPIASNFCICKVMKYDNSYMKITFKPRWTVSERTFSHSLSSYPPHFTYIYMIYFRYSSTQTDQFLAFSNFVITISTDTGHENYKPNQDNDVMLVMIVLKALQKFVVYNSVLLRTVSTLCNK